MDTEYNVDFKLDIVDEEPLQIKYLVKGVKDYRPITKKDINLYEFLSNAQKNNLNKIGLSRNLLISGQLYGEANIHESIKMMRTQYIQDHNFIQLSPVSELLLSVLIHENQTKNQIEQDKSKLEEQFKTAKITKALTIIIVNPQNIEDLGFNNVQFDHDDQCYGRFIIYIQKQIIYLIPKTKQNKFQLMQLIFLGLARHFKPRYLYIQELNYKLQENIFLKTNFNQWGAICPKKKYDGTRNDPLYLEFLTKYDQYVRMQNAGDSYQFDALNCFYNYQKCDNQIVSFISCQGNESLTQDMDHLNPKFCKLLNQDDLCLIQYGQLDQNPYQNMDDMNQKIQSIKLNQEIKFMINQYIELHPSIFRVLLMKLINLIDYFSISSYLFIIVILPYYLILDQSDSQAIQVFISIIPGFIIIISMIITIIVTIIFSIDDKILTGEQKQNVPIFVFKKQQASKFIFSLSDKENYQIIPSTGKVEKEKLLFNINIANLKDGSNKIKASPLIYFIPTEIFYKGIMIFCSIFYLFLSAAVLIIFITNRGGDSNKMAYSTAAFLAFLLLFYLFFAFLSLDYSQIGYKLFYLLTMFIEINLLSDIFISYNKSHSVEQNYQKLQKFLLRIFWNFIIFFIYIILDYSYTFDGGVMCPIVGYYVLKQITQIILLCFASQKIKQGPNAQMEASNDIGERLITQEAKFVEEEFDKYEKEPSNLPTQTVLKDQTDQQIKLNGINDKPIQTQSVFIKQEPQHLIQQQNLNENDGLLNNHQQPQLQQNIQNNNQIHLPNNSKPVSSIVEQQKQFQNELFKKK